MKILLIGNGPSAVEKEYGKVNVNIQDGTITPIEENNE